MFYLINCNMLLHSLRLIIYVIFTFQEENNRRFKIWNENWNKVVKHNFASDMKRSYHLGMNYFADMV